MPEKINDSAGFSDMVAAAPKTEFDDLRQTVGALSNNVGNLSADVDEMRRNGPAGAAVAQAMLSIQGLLNRVDTIERHLNKQMQDNSVQRDMLERNTRHSALDLAIKACPQGTDTDVLYGVYEAVLKILTGASG